MTLHFPPSSGWLKATWCCLLLYSSIAFGQKTICTGIVSDAKTGEPLPYVTIGFADSKIGTVSDINGNYRIETYYATSELSASFVGYYNSSKTVKKDQIQVIDFQLEVERKQLGEVVIKPDKDYENPAHVIFRRIVANKDANNREKLDSYAYELYNKVEIDIDNPREKLINFFLFKPIDFIFDNIDSLSDETPFLPAFLSESVADYYYKKQPCRRRRRCCTKV